MNTPDKEIREELYSHVAIGFERAITIIMAIGTKEKKIAALYDVAKLAYQSGLDRGYDLGWHVYGSEEDVET